MSRNTANTANGADEWRPISIPIIGPLTRENLWGWAKLILLVLAIRWAVAEPYKIPSGSMEPTLHGDPRFMRGDRVFINKWVYGLRAPFMNRRLFEGAAPQRWDVVVFKSPVENAEHKTLIKRIVGLPGERIQIVNGKIHVNGQPVEPPEELRGILYYTDSIDIADIDVKRSALYFIRNDRAFRNHPLREALQSTAVEKLPEEEVERLAAQLEPEFLGRVRAQLLEHNKERVDFRYGLRPEDEYSLVPEGHYLMLGDNSAHSYDGRAYGWVPGENIVGRAICIWWPLGRIRDLSGFSRTPWVIAPIALFIGVIGLMIYFSFIRRSWRVGRHGLPGVVEAGERVSIDLRAYGIRLPFSGRRVMAKARPQVGDVVVFLADPAAAHGHEYAWAAGIVMAAPGMDPPPGIPRPPKNEPPDTLYLLRYTNARGEALMWASLGHIGGKVTAVTRPWRKRRVIANAAKAGA